LLASLLARAMDAARCYPNELARHPAALFLLVLGRWCSAIRNPAYIQAHGFVELGRGGRLSLGISSNLGYVACMHPKRRPSNEKTAISRQPRHPSLNTLAGFGLLLHDLASASIVRYRVPRCIIFTILPSNTAPHSWLRLARWFACLPYVMLCYEITHCCRAST
jgi:hypothetical protein